MQTALAPHDLSEVESTHLLVTGEHATSASPVSSVPDIARNVTDAFSRRIRTIVFGAEQCLLCSLSRLVHHTSPGLSLLYPPRVFLQGVRPTGVRLGLVRAWFLPSFTASLAADLRCELPCEYIGNAPARV